MKKHQTDDEVRAQIRRDAVRRAWIITVVFAAGFVALVVYLAQPAERAYLVGHVAQHQATVVAKKPGGTCKGGGGADFRFSWGTGGAWHSGCADAHRIGDRVTVYQESNGLVTLDSPSAARIGFALLAVFIPALGVLAVWLNLRGTAQFR